MRCCRKKGWMPPYWKASNRIGGQILTEHPTFAPFIDADAQHISPGQNRILGLLKKYQLNAFPVFEEGKRFLKESLFDNEAEENETVRLDKPSVAKETYRQDPLGGHGNIGCLERKDGRGASLSRNCGRQYFNIGQLKPKSCL